MSKVEQLRLYVADYYADDLLRFWSPLVKALRQPGRFAKHGPELGLCMRLFNVWDHWRLLAQPLPEECDPFLLLAAVRYGESVVKGFCPRCRTAALARLIERAQELFPL